MSNKVFKMIRGLDAEKKRMHNFKTEKNAVITKNMTLLSINKDVESVVFVEFEL